jgi:orotate phosphoribosyltransferase
MNRQQLAKKIYEASHLTGSFLLRSGQTSSEYFDKYLFEADPALLAEISAHMESLIPVETQVLAGLEMGGIPVATALSLNTGLRVCFVRKKAKEYGTCKLAEGADVKGKKITIVEDVVTTGGAILDAARELRKLGAVVENVLCVIERDRKGRENLKAEGMELHPLYTMEELKEAAGQKQ